MIGWNIDGYYLRKYDQIKKYYRNGVLIDTVYKPLSTVYVHCDFGWGGLDNGHFVSGMFDLGSEQAWDDDQMRSGNRSNYNWYLKIITYDPPIQK